MRVLITNLVLSGRSGTECYARDLALELARQGHTPSVYSPRVAGSIPAELEKAGVPVADDLARLSSAPDVVHGHHLTTTAEALLRLPRVPGIFVCHDSQAWHDAPPRLPRVLRYVAVDENCRERLVARAGVPPDRVRVILNFVDMERFRLRHPLPAQPRRALVFSNYASERTHLIPVREACARLGLALDVAGAASGRPTDCPETLLPRYDLVFAKARAALEALASGCAVVLCDAEGVGGLVDPARFEWLRRWNFGRRTLTEPVRADVLAREIRRYDPADAARVTARVRDEAGLALATRELVDLYHEVLAESARAPARSDDERAAAADLLRQLEPQLHRCFGCNHELLQASAGYYAARARTEALQATLGDAEARAARLVRRVEVRLGGRARWAWGRLRRLAGKAARAGRPEGTPPVRAHTMPIIVGVPRSGTTLMRMLLDAHSQMAIPPETGFLPDLAAMTGSPAELRERALRIIVGSLNWPDFQLDPETLRHALATTEPFDPTAGARCFYRLYAARFGKTRWGDKTPDHGLSLDRIRTVLPEAFFIHMIRDGRDVAVSVRDFWFAPSRDYRVLAADWRDRILETRRQAAGTRRYLEVRYEELVRDTEAVVRRVCGAIDLAPEPGMLRYFERAPARLAEHEGRTDSEGRVVLTKSQRLQQQRMVTQPPDARRIGQWRTAMDDRDRADFVLAAGDLLAELRYER